MTARDLYHALIVKGFDLGIALDGRLMIEPAGKLGADIRAAVRKHRQALLEILKLEEERSKSKKGSGRARRPAG